jgi:hypothetical protein
MRSLLLNCVLVTALKRQQKTSEIDHGYDLLSFWVGNIAKMTLVPSLGSLLLPGLFGIPAALKAAVSDAL